MLFCKICCFWNLICHSNLLLTRTWWLTLYTLKLHGVVPVLHAVHAGVTPQAGQTGWLLFRHVRHMRHVWHVAVLSLSGSWPNRPGVHLDPSLVDCSHYRPQRVTDKLTTEWFSQSYSWPVQRTFVPVQCLSVDWSRSRLHKARLKRIIMRISRFWFRVSVAMIFIRIVN